MQKLTVRGIRLDTLLAMGEREIIDAVPESLREKIPYWRGAHLGNIALNLLEGRPYINVVRGGRPQRMIHLTDDHTIGANYAAFNASTRESGSEYKQQWYPEASQRYSVITGLDDPGHFGGMVLGYMTVDRLSADYFGKEHCYDGHRLISFGNIDPYSHAALEELFETSLPNLRYRSLESFPAQ